MVYLSNNLNAQYSKSAQIYILGYTLHKSLYDVQFCYKHRKEDIEMSKSNPKQTSPRAASAASKVLRDGRTGAASKTAAGSALSQTKPHK